MGDKNFTIVRKCDVNQRPIWTKFGMLSCVFWSSSKKPAKYLLNNCYFPPNRKILQKEVYKQKENLHG